MKPFQVVKHKSLELLIQRIAFSVVIMAIGNKQLNFSGQPYPIGLAKYLDLTFLFDSSLFLLLKVMLFAALLLYISNKFILLGLGYIFFYMVLLGTFENSQGGVSHYEHIVPLILLGQLLAYANYKILRLKKYNLNYTSGDLAVHFSKQAIVSIYVLSAIVKINKSGICQKFIIPFPCWIRDSPLIALKILRNHGRYYSDTLAKSSIDRGYVIANYLIDHPWVARLLFGGGLILELFAFLALINRRWSAVIGFMLIILHLSIYEIMRLNFAVNIFSLFIFLGGFPLIISRLLRGCLKSNKLS